MKRKIFLILLVLITIYTYKTTEEEIIIPDNSIRLRIIPNSNNSKDINIKEQVKKYLENDLYQLIDTKNNIEETRKIIKESIPRIDNNINKIFKENNYNEKYNINFGQNYFPEKNYKGKKYSEGMYESFVVTIGNGSGDNWWCVLFPNFCLIDLDSDQEYNSYIYNLIHKIF